MSDLTGIRLKLRRAREHRKAVNDHVRGFLKTPAYAVQDEIDPQTGQQHWRVKGNPRTPDSQIALLAGDCLYDFRCVLDHLAWQLGDMSGMKRPDRTLFPLFDDGADFIRHGFWRIEELCPEMVAAIARAQPCYGWNRYFNASLAALEVLVNIDKHRHLNVLAASLAGHGYSPGSPIGGGPSFVHEGPVYDGTIIATFPPEEVKVQFSIWGAVAFESIDPLDAGGDVERTLLGIDSAVWHVLEDFRREFFPTEEAFIKW